MIDAIEWILGALAIVLAGAAIAVGGQVIRDAWRGAFRAAPPGASDPARALGPQGQAGKQGVEAPPHDKCNEALRPSPHARRERNT